MTPIKARMSDSWEDNLYQQLSNYQEVGQELEVEVRFRHKKSDNQYSGEVNFAHFNRLKSYLEDAGVRRIDTTITDVRYSSGQRNRTENGVSRWEIKTRILNVDNHDYGHRFSLSKEESIPEPTFLGSIVSTRSMSRNSYVLDDYNLRVDMSKVSNNGEPPHLEVEMEMLDPVNPLDEDHFYIFMQGVDLCFNKFNGTEISYTIQDVEQLNAMVNSKLLRINNQPRYIDRRVLTEARNLKLDDIRWGGVVGGKYKMSVAHKTDGQRRMLILYQGKVWFVFSPFSYNLIYEDDNIQELTIYDGELIPQDRRNGRYAPNNTYWYQVIDAIYINGKDVRGFSLQDRIELVERSVHQLDMPSDVSISTKQIIPINSTDEFFQAVNTLLEQVPELDYQTDGLIFTPVNHGYSIDNHKVPLKDRLLRNMPDICKYKPVDQMTIDFFVIREPDTSAIRLYTADENNKGNILLFDGGPYFKFVQDTMIKQSHPLTDGIPDRTVVEYTWNYQESMFYPLRIRYEKSGPNRNDVAIDNWYIINVPISSDSIRGLDMGLVYKYQNRIKKRLYKSVIYDRRQGDYLLDIGSGEGGDVAKWMMYRKVIVVEPNLEHIEELKRRLVSFSMTDKVHIINAEGQDYQTIVPIVRQLTNGAGVDTISMMNSLTFFWENESVLKDLATTIEECIKPNGYFIWLVMDGDTVRQRLRPAFGGYKTDVLEFGESSITWKGDNQVEVYLPGTIVDRQKEYLTSIMDLLLLLPKFKEIYRYRAQDEKLLTDPSKDFSELFVYGKWERNALPGRMETSNGTLTPQQLQQLYDMQSEESEQSDQDRRLALQLATQEDKSTAPLVATNFQSRARSVAPSGRRGAVQFQSTFSPSVTTTPQFQSTFSSSVAAPVLPTTFVSPVDVPQSLQFGHNGGDSQLSMLHSPGTHQILTTNLDLKGNQLVRIATKGDGSCYVHSVLTACSEKYRTGTQEYQNSLATQLRLDLANSLFLRDRDGNLLYNTFGNNSILGLYTQQLSSIMDSIDRGVVSPEDIMNDALEIGSGVDASITGQWSHLNSRDNIGNSTFALTARLLGINVYVVSPKVNGNITSQSVGLAGPNAPSIVIAHVIGHYETLGVRNPNTGKITTVFRSSQDPNQQSNFINEIRSKVMKQYPGFTKETETISSDNTISEFLYHQVDKDGRLPDILYQLVEKSIPDTNGNILPNPVLEFLWKVTSPISYINPAGNRMTVELKETARNYYIRKAGEKIHQVLPVNRKVAELVVDIYAVVIACEGKTGNQEMQMYKLSDIKKMDTMLFVIGTHSKMLHSMLGLIYTGIPYPDDYLFTRQDIDKINNDLTQYVANNRDINKNAQLVQMAQVIKNFKKDIIQIQPDNLPSQLVDKFNRAKAEIINHYTTTYTVR